MKAGLVMCVTRRVRYRSFTVVYSTLSLSLLSSHSALTAMVSCLIYTCSLLSVVEVRRDGWLLTLYWIPDPTVTVGFIIY